jgi:hypothetical protein
MKTSLKSILTIAAIAAASLLTGCATPNLQATFTFGDEIIYGRVFNIWDRPDHAIKVLCGDKLPQYKEEFYSHEVQEWADNTGFCKKENLSQTKQIQVMVGIVNANGDGFALVAFPKKDFEIEKGDIVAVKSFHAQDGRLRRPAEIVRIAAKAKDATKENGCYWDAGVNASFRGFNQGGAICEGWHWKDHPYSNPKLLKQ